MKFDNIKAIAFDLDGTLVDTLPDLIAAANAMRAEQGLAPLPAERVREHVGDGIASLVHRALTDARDGRATDEQWQQAFRFFVGYYREHLTDHSQIYPGVLTALGLLRALKLPLAVVTNKSERLAEPLLRELKMADDFALLIGGDTLPEKKPSALPLAHTCELLGVKPADLLMVGDSANDVAAARAAGCPVVLVGYGYGDAAALDADLVIDDLGRLYDLIRPVGGEPA